MPAVIAHKQMAMRVWTRLKQMDISRGNLDAFLLGAQGPDLFFFHRILPWERGISYVHEGVRMHKMSPARLFAGFRDRMLEAEGKERAIMRGYVQGFFCHYALDRTAHPFVGYWQQVLRQERPAYGKADHTYHFCIESALDTWILRRETGRLPRDFPLLKVLPGDDPAVDRAIGQLYAPLFSRWFGVEARPEHLAKAPQDMRQILWLITDRAGWRRQALRPVEWVSRRGHFASCLLRPQTVEDWDYANEAHRPWHNLDDPSLVSTDGFWELMETATAEAAEMIAGFDQALAHRRSLLEITGDRGFASNLPGVYPDRPGGTTG